MSTLILPLSHNPSYTLLTLGLLQNARVEWTEANEHGEPSYGDIKGTEAVRAALEEGLPGEEVRNIASLR
jgi:hypothetical protein